MFHRTTVICFGLTFVVSSASAVPAWADETSESKTLSDLAKHTRTAPSFKDGESSRFKLFTVRPDSVRKKLGVVRGEVVSRPNGNPPEPTQERAKRAETAHSSDTVIIDEARPTP